LSGFRFRRVRGSLPLSEWRLECILVRHALWQQSPQVVHVVVQLKKEVKVDQGGGVGMSEREGGREGGRGGPR
jgi:hypothetical protein